METKGNKSKGQHRSGNEPTKKKTNTKPWQTAERICVFLVAYLHLLGASAHPASHTSEDGF